MSGSERCAWNDHDNVEGVEEDVAIADNVQGEGVELVL